MRVFVAGATGAIGGPLVNKLLAEGHEVAALTRSPDRARHLRTLGVDAYVGDALEPSTFERVLRESRPEVAVHQLTTFPKSARPIKSLRDLRNTNRLRSEGTAKLVAAARSAGVRRIIAQSIAFLYEPGDEPRTEQDPMIREGRGILGGIAGGVADAEEAVLQTSDIEGVALRYGGWYGPNTQFPPDSSLRKVLRWGVVPNLSRSSAHFNTTYIDDAASSVVAALNGPTGAFNVVDTEPARVANLVAMAAEAVGARPPRINATWPAALAGKYLRHLLLHQAPVSNVRSRTELGWRPTHATAAQAIRATFGTPADQHET